MKRDREVTEARQFKDPRSYVAKDGREVLFGLDWQRRKKELWERCGGTCEKEVPFWPGKRCWHMAEDPHHVIPRSKQRDDRLSNLQALCRYHHNLLDPRKPQWTKKVKDLA